MIEITDAPGAPDGPLGLSTDEVAEVEVCGVRWRLRTLTLADYLARAASYNSTRQAFLDSRDDAALFETFRAERRRFLVAGIRGWAGHDAELSDEDLLRIDMAGTLAADLAAEIDRHNTSPTVLLAGFR